MLGKAVETALNNQIHCELSSAYIYLSMSAYLGRCNHPGLARWMRHQAHEEYEHAMRIFGFVNDRGGTVRLMEIEQPRDGFGSPLEVFQAALGYERAVTKRIHELYELAVNEKDYATQTHLHWFIDEQVEEEKTAEGIVSRLEMAGDQLDAVLMLDRQLGERGDGN